MYKPVAQKVWLLQSQKLAEMKKKELVENILEVLSNA